MKNLTYLILIFISFNTASQPLNRSFESVDGKITLLGEVTLERLNEEPFGEWYKANYADYEVAGTETLMMNPVDSITIFMGTWCGDSKREVPRFIKILENVDYDLSRVKILCLNTGFQNYKQAPERQERGVNIHRVPTFIFHDSEGNEIDRIVEEPVVSFEKDINTILAGEEYNTAYPVAKKLIDYFESYSLKELKKMRSKLVKEFNFAENVYELNTYGYVLWTSFQIPEAQFVFDLNMRLFPEEVIVHQTYARFINSLGKGDKALSCIREGLRIEPENESLLAMRSYIREE